MSLWNSFMKLVGLSPAGGPPSSLTSVMAVKEKTKQVIDKVLDEALQVDEPREPSNRIWPEEPKETEKPKAAANPKPKPKAKPKAKKKAAPKETVDSLNKLTKANIQALAKKNLKIDLDVKTTKKVMIENFILAQSE